jgi:DNA polymerase-3 subunit delta'
VSDDADIPHPRQTLSLYGHAEAEQAFLEAYRASRMPHAWLIGGPRGVGKATLAYRMARFVFAHPSPTTPSVRNAAHLTLPVDHPVVRRIAAQGHPDLLALERVADEKGKVPMFIPVDMVRKTIGFFGSTAGEGGWRVCIVDSADEMNAAGANALLKILEEPPAKSLLLVVSHAPGRLLPTIRSRCRRLALRALSPDDVARAAVHHDAIAYPNGANRISATPMRRSRPTRSRASCGSTARTCSS